MSDCPCGTGITYAACCGKFISQQEAAATPEELMRSRYTAFTQNNFDYIVETMKSPVADNYDVEKRSEETSRIKWVNLEVLHASQNGNEGVVEFRAHFLLDNKKEVLHERSSFCFENGRWYYIDRALPNLSSHQKVGRNDLCPCGSNKKYKKCCGC